MLNIPLLSDQIKINWFTLSFEKDLEQVFKKYYFHDSLRHVRISLSIGLVFYAIFGLLDASLVPNAKNKLWFIRFAIIFPYVLLVYLYSFSKHFQKYMQLSVASAVLVAGLGIIAMILIAPYPASYSYYAGLILVFLYGYTFIKLRFIWASGTCWLIVIAYEISATWINPTPIPTLINNNFFFLSGNILGMVACYSFEFYLRRDFIQARLLDTEKKKVQKINMELEERVEERTAQLRKTNKELEEEILERKRAEEALRESEEKYRFLVDHAETAIFIAQDGVIKFANPMTIELTKCTAEELTQIQFTEFIHPGDKSMVLERHRKRLKGEEVPHSYDFRMLDKNGLQLWCHLNAVLITWEGQPATLNFLRDISAQKKLEAKLQRAEKMEALGTLAGGVAHDLNNVLSGVVSYPDLLLLELPDDSPLRKPIITIQESGQKAATIVQDLLTLARRGVSVSEIVNLNQIVQQYLDSLECEKLLSFHSSIHIETELTPDLFNMIGSPVHLSKTIMNLVSNAAEAMPEGGSISLKTSTCYLDNPIAGYETIEEGEYVCLTIADTGTGISSVDIDKIFEPFYTKKVMGRSGTGLGMSVVWGTVKDHQGYIDVHSSLNHGTKFTLYFPGVRKELTDSEPIKKINDYIGQGESILVIDDIEEQRVIAGGMLEKLGYKVKSVASGEEAVKYMENRSVDLIILDMIMDPGIDGLETYEKILKLHPQQKAVIASGYSETERVKMALNLGANTYLKKPYLLDKVGLAVRTALNEPHNPSL